jgi:hypothetical protein
MYVESIIVHELFSESASTRDNSSVVSQLEIKGRGMIYICCNKDKLMRASRYTNAICEV